MKILYADFNNFDEHGNLPLTCRGSVDSIAELETGLEDGEEVTLSDGELTVVARVYMVTDGTWEARGEFEFSR